MGVLFFSFCLKRRNAFKLSWKDIETSFFTGVCSFSTASIAWFKTCFLFVQISVLTKKKMTEPPEEDDDAMEGVCCKD